MISLLKKPYRLGVLAVIVSTLLSFLYMPSAQAAYLPDTTKPEIMASAEDGLVDPEVSADGTQARSESSLFALTDFLRSNKGTAKLYHDTYYGYRYPMAAKDAFAVVVAPTAIIVYINPAGARAVSMDPFDTDDQMAFRQLLYALDASVAQGGVRVADRNTPSIFTTETNLVHDGFLYRFAVEVEPGQFYVCVYANPATTIDTAGTDDSAGALFAETGLLVSASQVTITKPPEGFAALAEFFGGIDYRPFWVSLRTSLVAMVFVFVLGLAAAHYSFRINPRLRDILDSIFTVPMVLPPTVCGFLLLVAFGNSTGFGRWLIDHGVVLVFTWPGAVIAAFVVAFPLMYRTARGAFEGLDPYLSDAARTLGWSDLRIFFKLTLPLAWPSIAAGTILSFARALGEFGATLFVAGNYAGITQTMPLAIYFQWMGGRTDIATFWVVVVILISLLAILFINRYASRTQRYRQVGADEDLDADWASEKKRDERA